MAEPLKVIMAKALIDADPTVFGYHEVHIQYMMPRVEAQLAALAAEGVTEKMLSDVMNGRAAVVPREPETKCPECGRHVMVKPRVACGFLARCGRRLTRIDECVLDSAHCIAAAEKESSDG